MTSTWWVGFLLGHMLFIGGIFVMKRCQGRQDYRHDDGQEDRHFSTYKLGTHLSLHLKLLHREGCGELVQDPCTQREPNHSICPQQQSQAVPAVNGSVFWRDSEQKKFTYHVIITFHYCVVVRDAPIHIFRVRSRYQNLDICRYRYYSDTRALFALILLLTWLILYEAEINSSLQASMTLGRRLKYKYL